MEELRNLLGLLNMRKIADLSGISYSIIRNFKSGRKKYLTSNEYNAIISAINNLAGR